MVDEHLVIASSMIDGNVTTVLHMNQSVYAQIKHKFII